MSKFEIAKKFAKWTVETAVCASTSKVLHDVIDANVDAETRLDKAMIWIGSIAITGVATDQVWKQFEQKTFHRPTGDFSKIDFSQCQPETE